MKEHFQNHTKFCWTAILHFLPEGKHECFYCIFLSPNVLLSCWGCHPLSGLTRPPPNGVFKDSHPVCESSGPDIPHCETCYDCSMWMSVGGTLIPMETSGNQHAWRSFFIFCQNVSTEQERDSEAIEEALEIWRYSTLSLVRRGNLNSGNTSLYATLNGV